MYRLYLDEHGTDSMTRLDLEKKRFLSLTGVMMKIDHARDYLVPSFNKIKGDILGEDPDQPICFHRTDIRQAKGPFRVLADPNKRTQFDEAILGIMRNAEYTVITVLLDKVRMESKSHWERTHPYHFPMEVLMEKYALCLRDRSSVGDVMPEARGKHQDNSLQLEFARVKEKGTRYAEKDVINSTIPSKSLKFRTKKDNIAGLQLCDLLAHPSHYAIRRKLQHQVSLGDYAERVSEVLLESKYNRSKSGIVWGWGAKWLP